MDMKVEANLEEILERATEELNKNTLLPSAVERFCRDIDKNFEKTVRNLELTASKLHQIAADMELRAKELRDAGPDVSGHVEKWVTYERESNNLEVYWRPLLK